MTSVCKLISMLRDNGTIRNRVIDLVSPRGGFTWDVPEMTVTFGDGGYISLEYDGQIRNLTPEAVQDLQTGRYTPRDYFENLK